jgi:hypothetical protein
MVRGRCAGVVGGRERGLVRLGGQGGDGRREVP